MRIMVFFLAFAGLVAVSCGLAFWRGGGPERLVAALFLIAWLASIASNTPAPLRYHSVEIAFAVIDTVLLIGLLLVASRANRRWPSVAAGLQLLIVLAHAARAINPLQIAVVYMIMTAVWPFLQLLLLLGGTVLHWRRTAVLGAVPSWSPSSRTRPAMPKR